MNDNRNIKKMYPYIIFFMFATSVYKKCTVFSVLISLKASPHCIGTECRHMYTREMKRSVFCDMSDNCLENI